MMANRSFIYIGAIKDDNKVWLHDFEHIDNYLLVKFAMFFRFAHVQLDDAYVTFFSLCISFLENDTIFAIPTVKEIYKVLKSMHLIKSF